MQSEVVIDTESEIKSNFLNEYVFIVAGTQTVRRFFIPRYLKDGDI